MGTRKKTDDLVAALPERTTTLASAAEAAAAEVGFLSALVPITGMLTGKDGDHIVLVVAMSRMLIATEDVLAINVEASQPSQAGSGILVTVQVAPATEIREVHKTTAAALAPGIGRRPFVYAVPSGTDALQVDREQWDTLQKQWCERVGLGGYQAMIENRKPRRRFRPPVRHSDRS